MKGLVLVSYGMGGAGIETWQSGLRQLVQRVRHLGYETMGSPYKWSDVNTIAGIIGRTPLPVPAAVIGASLGANEAPDVARRTTHPIKYLGGFQSSLWGAGVAVPPNVAFADNIYNPGILGFLRTLGMGSYKWTAAPGNKTTVIRNIPIYESHPDDWGVAQDIIVSRIQHLLVP